MEDNGIALTWRQVQDLTNLCHSDFEDCPPYISDYSDSGFAEQIHTCCELLNNYIGAASVPNIL